MNPVTYFGRLPGNDVVIASVNVSRRHAKLIVTDLGVTVHDLDSHNGVFLNGAKVRSSPVVHGDLLYIGDVCVEVERSAEKDASGGISQLSMVHSDIADHGDPQARGCLALLRAVDVCSTGDDDRWLLEIIQICRELVEATVAVFVEVTADGELQTPVVLQPESERTGPAFVQWEVVQKAVSSLEPQYARDVLEANLITLSPEGAHRAVMAIPLMTDANKVFGVVYLSRPQAGSVFSDVEYQVVQGVAGLAGFRLERIRKANEITQVGADGSALAVAHRRLMNAEDMLSAEQSEVQRLTQQLHSLEGDNLKLRQQSESERQTLREQQIGQERETLARFESTLAEQKIQFQKEATDLQAVLQNETDRTRAETEKHKEEKRLVEEAHRTLATDLEQQKLRASEAQDAVAAGRAAQEVAEAKLVDLETSLSAAHQLLAKSRDNELVLTDGSARESERSEQGAANLRTALRASVLPTLVDHVEAVAAGEALTTAAVARQLTVLYVALVDFDAFCEKASVEDVKIRLDCFCKAVSARAQANGGRIDQVTGHGHFVVFAADAANVIAAVRCALEITAIVAAEATLPPGSSEPAVVAGVDSGMAIAGFFGGDDGVSYVEAGRPLVVARAAVDHAPQGNDGIARGVVISDAVRLIVAAVPSLRVTRLGPAWVKGVNAAVPLSLIEFDHADGPNQ